MIYDVWYGVHYILQGRKYTKRKGFLDSMISVYMYVLKQIAALWKKT